jgi:hypothetical protein
MTRSSRKDAWVRCARSMSSRKMKDTLIRIQILDRELECIERLANHVGFATSKLQREAKTRIPAETPGEMEIRRVFLNGILDIIKEGRDLTAGERETIRDVLIKLRSSVRGGFSSANSQADSSCGDNVREQKDLLNGNPVLEWDEEVEDRRNLDLGLHFLARNLDYLKGCRKLLVIAGADLGPFELNPAAHLSRIYRYSELGHAHEMAAMADHYLIMALTELSCLTSTKKVLSGFSKIFWKLTATVLEELVDSGRFQRSISKVEDVHKNNTFLIQRFIRIRSTRGRSRKTLVFMKRGA